jgi:hypothetical protein
MRRQGRARKALADCRRAPSIRLTVWLAIFSVIFVPLERLFPVHPQKVFRKQNRGRGLVGTVHVTDGAIAMGVILVGLVWGYFVHANLRWRLGPLEWIVATPGFHHWHHTYGLQRNCNYASMLPWIDRLFGSHYLPKVWPSRYGIPERTAASLAGQLIQPFQEQRADAAAANVTERTRRDATPIG